MTGCNALNKEDSDHVIVYSLSGSNEQIQLNNGVMVFTPSQQILYGGEFSVLDKDLKDITFYSTDIYYLKDGVEEKLMSDIVNMEGTTIDIENNKNLGKLVGTRGTIQELLPTLETELYFKLETRDINKEENNYVLKLTPTKVMP